MANNKLYDESSIQSLSPLEFTRLRPGVYCGSTEYATQPVIEIVSNAIDEFKAGHGNQIKVTIGKDRVCSVRDYGQGFLINSKREDGKTILQAAFDTLNTSGKFSEDGVYEGTALGLNGIGSKLTNFLSHWLIVRTCRDGKFEEIKFVEGVFESRKTGKMEANDTVGTYVEWLPSEEFFTSNEVEMSKIKELFRVLVCLCPGLTIDLQTDEDTFSFYSEHGLNDLVDEKVSDTELINNRMNMHFEEGKNKMDMVITYTSRYSLNMVSYVNTGETDAGPHITQIKTILTREFNKYFKEKKWLKTGDTNFSGDDLQEGLFVAFNITAPNVSYDAQTKSRIVKIDMTPFTQSIVENLQYWFNNNEKDIKLIFDKAAGARKAREAAKKARERVREGNKKKEKALKFDTKLADCNSKDRLACEIYITEGDSASGNLKTARSNEFQAVMPVRGKVLNCQKSTYDKISKNAEIMTMIDAFGITLDPKTLKATYEEKDLRYGKIIIASDADVDGAHIKNLFYTFIWNICPQLIIDGHVYALIAPLYRITEGKDKYIYVKNDAALEEWKAQNVGKKYVVNRMKGLGEMDVEQTEECLTGPGRVLQQITVDDVNAANALFDQLMGTAAAPRKEYIKIHSKEATYNAE